MLECASVLNLYPNVASAHFPGNELVGHLVRSSIHERTISLRFLGIISRVLRLMVFCMDFLNHKEREGKGCGFLPGFPFSFTVYTNAL